MSNALNVYGDVRQIALDGCGIDISSQRFDELDRSCIELVLSNDSCRGFDLGCGLGTPSIAFAIAGADMTLVDKLDFRGRFEALGAQIPLPNLRFIQSDLRSIEHIQVLQALTFVYSQRTLHYLTYADASRVLQWAAARLILKGRLLVSVSGLHSELAEGYAGARQPITRRFAQLAPHPAENHNILADVCLYTDRELHDLVIPLGFRPIDIWISKFGNVKAIFERI